MTFSEWLRITKAVKTIRKEKNMLNFLTGYRTYLAVILIIVHQGLKYLGLDIPDANISMAIDVFFAILAAIFRKLSNGGV